MDSPHFTDHVPIDGHGDLIDFEPQSFQAEDIVLLQDGGCASTCALVAEELRTEMGVRQIVVGGRPQPGPMQGVGNVKGGEVWDAETIVDFFDESRRWASHDLQAQLDASFSRSDVMHAINRSKSLSINSRNKLRRGDEFLTPLQFAYDAADCRFFYTAEMYANQSKVWSFAEDAMWNNGPCVEGSRNHPSSVSFRAQNVLDKIADLTIEGGHKTKAVKGSAGQHLAGARVWKLIVLACFLVIAW